MDTSAGKVWTDDNGMTLYTFDQDKSAKSSCVADCAKIWPPYLAPADAKPEGDWTITSRRDGTMMIWAYKGHPVYTYTKDKKPGDINGDGVGGLWRLARAD